MTLLKLYYRLQRVPLDEMYRKVIAKAKRCRSPDK
jgi:hypothetical protein